MKLIYGFLGLVLILGLSGCLFKTREEVQKAEEDRQLKEQVASIQKSKADSEVKYTDQQSEIRALDGRIDVVEHNNAVHIQTLKAEIENLRRLLDLQNDKIKMIDQHVEATETRLTAAIQAVASTPVSEPADSKVAGQTGSPKSGNAVFDEAESLMGQKEYKRAILKYQAYRDKYPKGKFLAESTYKIGACFFELGAKKDAKEFFQELIETYPSSPFAKKAKSRLAKMK